MTGFTDKLLVVLPRLSPYMNRNLRLPRAYVNLVGFFQKRYRIEAHVITSAESYVLVPKLENVKTVLAVHPDDIEFVNCYVLPLSRDVQNIMYEDAYDAANFEMPLRGGLSVEDRIAAVTVREKTVVNHIAKTYYDIIVDFESPQHSAYNLSPRTATIFLRVSVHNQTVKGFLKGKPYDDICSLLAYDGARRPLGSWGEELR